MLIENLNQMEVKVGEALANGEGLLEKRLNEKLNNSVRKYQQNMEININWVLSKANHKVVKVMKRLEKDRERGTVYEPKSSN